MAGNPLPGGSGGLNLAGKHLRKAFTGVTVWYIPGAALRCGKWPAYYGFWDSDGYTLRCRGCLKAVGRCTCGN